MTSRYLSGLRSAVVAAAVVAGGLLAVAPAQAAPLAVPAAGIVAGSDATPVHWRGRHWGHHHHHGWGRHWGWRHHHHRHHHWGGWRHRHHHHHWRHRHFY